LLRSLQSLAPLTAKQLLYRDGGYSLTLRFPEYNCRKVIYDSCIRQTVRFSGRHFGTKMW